MMPLVRTSNFMTFEDEVTTYDVNQGYQTYDITLRLSLRVYTTHITLKRSSYNVN